MKKWVFLFPVFFAGHLFAQPEKLGNIEIYGTANVTVTDIKETIGIKEGDLIDRKTFSEDAIAKKIRTVPGIAAADVSLICCDDKQGRSMLYIGISGSNKQTYSYHDDPKGNLRLDAYILGTYERYEEVWKDAVKAGQSGENDEQGHVLLTYPPAFPLQDSFVLYASSHVSLLRQVLRGSADAAHRQAASWILPFTSDKKSIVEDLLYAAGDRDETVRNNAMRALGVMGRYRALHPSSGINIPGAMFISMLHSIVWTDRNKGAMLLEALTEKRDSTLLQLLRTDALRPIIEMARWKTTGHALFSLIILGRIAGISDEEIFAAMNAANKDALIDDWVRRINEH